MFEYALLVPFNCFLQQQSHRSSVYVQIVKLFCNAISMWGGELDFMPCTVNKSKKRNNKKLSDVLWNCGARSCWYKRLQVACAMLTIRSFVPRKTTLLSLHQQPAMVGVNMISLKTFLHICQPNLYSYPSYC